MLQVVTSNARRGAEVFAFDLERELREQRREVRTVALHDGGASGTLPFRTLGRRRLTPRTLTNLRGELRPESVVIAHGSAALPACALASVGMSVPFIYRNIGDPEYWVDTSARRARVRVFLRRARAIVALWPGAAGTITRLHGIRPSLIYTIPNGVSGARFPLVDEAARVAARARVGLDESARTVIYLGALSVEKQVDTAIRAVSRLSDVLLVVVGTGPERARLEALAHSCAPGRVRFLGETADPSVALATADALVLPSRTEGMPAVLIEAGLMGLPVVATDVGGVREIVVDGETGFVVAPNHLEELTAALDNALEASPGVGLRARARCLALFEIGVVGKAWGELLDQIELEAGER